MNDRKIIKEERLDNNKVIIQTLRNDLSNREIHKIILPKITTEELIERYKRIKPIVNIEEVYYFLKEFTVDELINTSYIWQREKNKREVVNKQLIETIGEFPCYHTYGYKGFFKPSIEEVLSQFPDEMLTEANAFYLYRYPKTAKDLNKNIDILNAGCHKSFVKALKLKK